jgi:chitinase
MHYATKAALAAVVVLCCACSANSSIDGSPFGGSLDSGARGGGGSGGQIGTGRGGQTSSGSGGANAGGGAGASGSGGEGGGGSAASAEGGMGGSPVRDDSDGGMDGGSDGAADAARALPGRFMFSAYKDTGINMNWNTNVISTNVSGAAVALATDLQMSAGARVTLAFATGECGSENWAGLAGATMATSNVPLLVGAGIDYVISTGGAAGLFTCASDAGFQTFVDRWMSPRLVGIDFDIEAGQTQAIIDALVARIQTGQVRYPGLRFSLTVATLANNNGASRAESLGPGVADSFNLYGDETLQSVSRTIGTGWPSYLTVNLMTMDYGAASPGVCVVAGGNCDMGQSAIQAAYNLHDHWGVPYENIEVTPMIGGNDVSSEHFTLADADTVATFAISRGLAGVHYWSYDRDTDCPPGAASATCNSLGNAGTRGFLLRFLAAGLR